MEEIWQKGNWEAGWYRIQTTVEEDVNECRWKEVADKFGQFASRLPELMSAEEIWLQCFSDEKDDMVRSGPTTWIPIKELQKLIAEYMQCSMIIVKDQFWPRCQTNANLSLDHMHRFWGLMDQKQTAKSWTDVILFVMMGSAVSLTLSNQLKKASVVWSRGLQNFPTYFKQILLNVCDYYYYHHLSDMAIQCLHILEPTTMLTETVTGSSCPLKLRCWCDLSINYCIVGNWEMALQYDPKKLFFWEGHTWVDRVSRVLELLREEWELISKKIMSSKEFILKHGNKFGSLLNPKSEFCLWIHLPASRQKKPSSY